MLYQISKNQDLKTKKNVSLYYCLIIALFNINIASSKLKTINLYNQYLTLKIISKILVYINKSKINQEISLLYIILRKYKTIIYKNNGKYSKFFNLCYKLIINY